MHALPEIFHGYGILVHLGALLYVIGFLIRDQLILRLMLLTGTMFYSLYYFLSGPLWEPLLWDVVLGSANLYIICLIVIERTTFRMTADQKRLYAAFSSMSPGEFRRILKLCTLRKLDAREEVTREGEYNAKLYYVLDGSAEVQKGGTSFSLAPGSFVGELSYLLKTAATATVRIPKDALIAVWNHSDLEDIERASPAIRVAMREILNVDLAAKVSNGQRD